MSQQGDDHRSESSQGDNGCVSERDMALFDKIYHADGWGQVNTTDLDELYGQYQRAVGRNFKERIESFKGKQEKLISNAENESKLSQKALSKLEANRQRILRDIRKA